MGGSPTSSAERAQGGAGRDILALVEEQVALGPRVPGSPAHDRLALALEERLCGRASRVVKQEFDVHFRGKRLRCANLIGVFPARGARRDAADRLLLLGTHYDTRPRADRDADPLAREQPIPGANDGGSGTAVLLHMLDWLSRAELPRDVAVAFFDAEDLGGIDGKEFSLGARRMASAPPEGLVPSEVLVLDMVGGRGMVLDIDAHCLAHPPSLRLSRDVFSAGASLGIPAFASDKPDRLKYIISDHFPFLEQGIASCILIDIDYPQWHTQADTPAAMSAESLSATEEAVRLFLSRLRG